MKQRHDNKAQKSQIQSKVVVAKDKTKHNKGMKFLLKNRFFAFIPTGFFLIFFFLLYESTMGVHVFPILNTPSHLPPRTIPLGHPSAPAPSILYPALNLDW